MKKITKTGLIILSAFLVSCSSTISTKISKTYSPIDYNQKVFVLPIIEPVPADAERLGAVKIGDSGFGINCGYQHAMQKAKNEARKVGGNILKIEKHKYPSILGSSCHRIWADIYKVENAEGLYTAASEESIPNDEYALIHIFRYSGYGYAISYDLYLGNEKLCRVTNNFKTTVKVTKDGYNKIWAKTEAKEEVPIHIEMGKHYYIRCGLGMGIMVGRPLILTLEDESFIEEFNLFNPK